MGKNLPGIFNESQILEAERTEICWTNYPRSVAKWDLTLAENEYGEVCPCHLKVAG